MTHKNKPPRRGEDDLEPDDAVIGRALRGSLIVFVLIGLAVVAGVFFYPKGPAEKVAEKSTVLLPEVRDTIAVEIPTVSFTDVTTEAGIHFRHVNGAYGKKLLPETMGSGCAFFDHDNDGDQDLLLINSTYWPGQYPSDAKPPTMALYQNDGTGHFTDVTNQVGLDKPFYGTGVAVGDFDGDGDVDLFVTAVGPNHLFRNDGGKFVEITDQMKVAGDSDRWSSSAGFFDYDNDGDLDLFVCNYVQWSREFDLAQGFTLTGSERAYGSPKAFEGTFSYLYRNDGDHFTDVSQQAGIQVVSTTNKPMGKSLGLAPVDLNRDGWIDLVVANDTVQNFVFLNQQDGTFREIGALSGIGFDSAGNARGAMGIDTARFRNDHSLGIGIGNFANEMTALYVAHDNGLQFVDDAISTGLGPATRLLLTFGLFFFDYDLDGRLDLFAANGHLEDDIHKVQSTQHYEQPPQLFWNCGPDSPTEFQSLDAKQCGADLTRPMVGRGAAYADIDGDGDLDIVVTATGMSPRLLRNDQKLGNHWIRLRLRGNTRNKDAIGAWVEVTVAGRVLRRQVMPTRGYLSQSELPITIGLGNSEKIESILIRWSNGTTQLLQNIPFGKEVTVEQTAASALPGT